VLVLPGCAVEEVEVAAGEGVEQVDQQLLAVLQDQVARAVHAHERHVEQQRQVPAEVLVVLIRDLRQQDERQVRPGQGRVQAPWGNKHGQTIRLGGKASVTRDLWGLLGAMSRCSLPL
jgi:hypothetical protein